MYRKTAKKSLALFLVLVMCISLLPVSALAEEAEEGTEAEASAEVLLTDEYGEMPDEQMEKPGQTAEEPAEEADSAEEPAEEESKPEAPTDGEAAVEAQPEDPETALPPDEMPSEEPEKTGILPNGEAETEGPATEESGEPVHEHSFTAVVTAPTCTDQGYTTYTCECGESHIDDYTEALGHSPKETEEIPAALGRDGRTAGSVCAVCGETLEGCEVIPALVTEEEPAEESCGLQEEDSEEKEETAAEKTVVSESTEESPHEESDSVDEEQPLSSKGKDSARTEANDAGVKENEQHSDAEPSGPFAFDPEPFTESIENDGVSNEELLDAYADQQLNKAKGTVPRASNNAYRKLYQTSPTQAAVYSVLKPLILDVAAGRRTSTAFTGTASELEAAGVQIHWTAKELGYSSLSDSNHEAAYAKMMEQSGLREMKLSVGTLLADCPYEMYWFDKTTGYVYSFPYTVVFGSDGYIEITDFRISFAVSQNYAGSGSYTTTKVYADTINNAVANARSIVNQASGYSDSAKLEYYRQKICDLTDYNHSAADNPYTPYGNPWQIIWVFDGNAGTKVVCEGYAKSFQYLCELSSFSQTVNCWSVTGIQDEDHMWNIVSINGRNYHVDVTYCDNGLDLFLKGYSSGNPQYGYTFICNGGSFTYRYNSEMFDVLGLEILTIIPDNQNLLDAPVLTEAFNSATGVRVSWKKVNGAEKYRLLRKNLTKGETDWTYVGETTALTMIDKSVASASRYTFTVECIDSWGNVASFRDEAGRTCTYIAKADITKLEAGVKGVTITWSKPAGAKNFRVMRRVDGTSTWTVIAVVEGTSYIDQTAPKGVKLWYTVRGVSMDNKVVINSYNGTGWSLYHVNPPVMTEAFNSATGVRVSWKAVTGAAKYRLLRKNVTKNETAWTTITETKDLTFIDKSAVSSNRYTYTVQCIDANGRTSSAINAAGRTCTYIAMSKITAIGSVTNGVKLVWSKPAGAKNFRVMRRQDGTDKWTVIKVIQGTSYVDTTAKKNVKYWYTVRGVSIDNTVVINSYNATGWSVTRK